MGTVFDSAAQKCQCPHNTVFDSAAQKCQCPHNTDWNSAAQKCQCPHNTVFDSAAQKCQCPDNTVFNSAAQTCQASTNPPTETPTNAVPTTAAKPETSSLRGATDQSPSFTRKVEPPTEPQSSETEVEASAASRGSSCLEMMALVVTLSAMVPCI